MLNFKSEKPKISDLAGLGKGKIMIKQMLLI